MKNVDPGVFQDQIALQTSWTPLQGADGASFRSVELIAVAPHRWEYRPTAASAASCLFIAGLGLTVFLCGVFVPSDGSAVSLVTKASALIVGPFIVFLAGVMYRSVSTPVVFDKQRGCFWKGRIKAPGVPGPGNSERYAAFTQIHALQLISKRVWGEVSWTDYQLNLVMSDAGRINVVSHGAGKQIRQEATALANFLERPMWDAARR